MKKILLLILFVPFLGNAQENEIRFEQNLSWSEIKAKAKAENKFIFVDCFTTWCGPCKWMDKNVYSKDTVSAYVNAKFLSVRLQMDTSKTDNIYTKNCYSTAHSFQEQFKVNAYPSYLFFSPNGEIVHKGVGAKRINEFCSLIADATDPDRQYYVMLNNYRQSKMEYIAMPQLAYEADDLGDTRTAEQVADDYLHNYLDRLDENNILVEKNFFFVGRFIKRLRSSDKIFVLYYRKPQVVDSIFESRHFSRACVENVITREEITPKINAAKDNKLEPNWKAINQIVKKKYGAEYAEYCITKAEVAWYKYKKEWNNYVKYFIREAEDTRRENIQPGFGSMIYWNNKAFEIFRYSDHKSQLKKALYWVDLSLSMANDPTGEVMDTKANILYKLGRKEEGISLEEKTLAIAPTRKDIRENFEKMQKDLPTWSTNP